MWILLPSLTTTFSTIICTKNWKWLCKCYFFHKLTTHCFFSENAFVNMFLTNKTPHCFFNLTIACSLFIIYSHPLPPLTLCSLHIPNTRMRTASIMLYKTSTCVHKLYLNLATWKWDRIRVQNAPAHIWRESSSIPASDTPNVHAI